ncbi:MAG: hypothetical protein ACE5FF_05115 [Saprospiraceae bacterium]
MRYCTTLLLLNSLTFLLVLSFAKTRIVWYMVPVYPSLALLAEKPLVFDSGAVLMVCEPAVFAALDAVYSYAPFRTWDSCKLLTIKGPLKKQ